MDNGNPLAGVLAQLLTYDPDNLPQGVRDQVARILQERAEHEEAAAELHRLRARQMTGEKGLQDLIELKTRELTKERVEYMQAAGAFVREHVDLAGLQGVASTALLLTLQSLRVPLPILLEIIGVDLDAVMRHAATIKTFLSGQQDSKD
ncbi:MAG TPA: hypothetical protein VLA88_00355 [Candidatus Saccharimonadales bacterium]|nr:hypothetical protein [Candidatus Saccharimonadales bacterium]